jgi:predicted transcriptional regulator
MKRQPHVMISRPEQLRALISPVRQELVDVLSRMGAASLAEIATVLGRPADGLYYHVRLLVRVGLVFRAGSRNHAGRPEALFRAIAPQLALPYKTSPKSHVRAVTAIVASMLRLGTRDFRRASSRPGYRFRGSRRELWALRTTGWLAPGEVKDVNTRILALSRAVSQPKARGKLYAITILLTPMDHGTKRKAGRTVKPRGRKKA